MHISSQKDRRARSDGTNRPGRTWILATLCSMALLTRGLPAQAADSRIEALEAKLVALQAELAQLKTEQQKKEAQQIANEQKTDVLAEAVDTIKSRLTIPEEMKLESRYGLSPGAAKVYGRDPGLSIGGYGELIFKAPTTDKGPSDLIRDDMQRFVLYTGYKFNDWIVFNSEVEFEHATTSGTISSAGGDVSVEMAYLDFFLSDYANIRAGEVLVPMGMVNEAHEPTFYYGVNRPEVDQRIIPSTWREIGAGLFAEPTDWMDYRVYAINGFNALGFRPSGFRDARQKANRAIAEDWAFVGRVDFQPIDDLTFGTSVYAGNSGQNQEVEGVDVPSTPTTIWEGHGQYTLGQFVTRAEIAASWVGDAKQLTELLREEGSIGENDVIANQMLGLYVEGAYDIMPWIIEDTEQNISPFVRFEWVNTQQHVPAGFIPNGKYDDTIWTVGLDYKPIPQVVAKIDYRMYDPAAGQSPNTFNMGLGFVF